MKKRYFVSLDQETADQFKTDLSILNLPQQTFSNLVNEWMTSFAPILHGLAEKKLKGEQMSFKEVMGTVINQMERSMEP